MSSILVAGGRQDTEQRHRWPADGLGPALRNRGSGGVRAVAASRLQVRFAPGSKDTSRVQRLAILVVVAVLAACSTSSRRDAGSSATGPQASGPSTGSSRYYKDDGPGESPPADLDNVPDAVPRVEPLHRFANRPYTVLGRNYVPATVLKSYHERGVASWYGRKFHGQKTSIGETYDMYGMTAAHPTLPLPSYARVTNVATGRSVVVRVNDRGPFLHDRVIDLSYAAAHRLGIAQRGSGEVDVEAIIPGAAAATVASVAPLPPVSSVPEVASPVQITAIPMRAAPVGVAVTAAPSAVATAPPTTTGEGAGVSTTAPSAAAGPAAATSASPATGYAVQLGAFSSYPNAQNFLAHVQNQLASAQVEARVRQAGGLYRVYVGPYAERDEARRVGERITQAFGFPTSVGPH
jgi:rare lipoprotein A